MTHSDWYTPKAGSANTFLRDCALTVKNISSFVIDECHQSDKHCTRNLSPDQNSIPKTESTISQHTGLLVNNFLLKDAFWSIIYKICEYQPFWTIFFKICYKISKFWANFLEFFGLRSNVNVSEWFFTWKMALLLFIERDRKNRIPNKPDLQVCKSDLARQTQTKQVTCKSTWTCPQH